MPESAALLAALASHLDGRLVDSFRLDQSGAVVATVAAQDLRAAARFIHEGLDARFVISAGTDCRPAGQGFRVDHLFSQDRR